MSPTESISSDTRTRSLLLLLIAVVVSSLVVAAERWVLPWALGVPRPAYLMGFIADSDQVDDVRINAMGFAGDVLALGKKPDSVRVLTLGGSALFNRRLAERLKSRLETLAQREVEVLGAALRSHTTWSSVHKYRYLSGYDFDYVLLYHAINDLWANHVPARSFRPDYSHLEAWYKRNWLLDHSVISRLVYNRVLHRKARRVPMGARYLGSDVFLRNLETLIREIRQDGGTPILMTFAWSIPPTYTFARFKAEKLGYNNPERYDPCPAELWGPVHWVREGIVRHNQIIRSLAAEHDVALIDQEDLMGKDLANFGDVCHLSENGTDLFIEHIVDYMSAGGLLE